MWYSKKEEFSFRIPQEHTAYLKLKDDLRAAGIRFTEEGGATHQTIEIRTTGTFKVNEDGSFDIDS